MNRKQFVDRFRATADSRGDDEVERDRPPVGSLRPAAVLIPVVNRDGDLSVIFTRRTDHLPDHAGQISFPGGRIEADDQSPEDAALRETEEEIGLHRSRVEILGRLERYDVRTGFSVTPVVGMVEPPFDLVPDAHEVAETFEVPLAFLLDPENHQLHERKNDGGDRHFYAVPYGDHFIWGATAGMLMNLYQRMAEK
ncbi:MAG: CoA pyrophosphatase [Rhodospirillales bacterium]|jgi:8-oxo-dGTP pyrophosphatase MutT (NUDIX family)|nr:CoA pyrophosphatase [Rhodospirillales bacterium]